MEESGPDVVGQRIAEVRHLLVDIRQYGETIARREPAITEHVDAACTAVGAVLHNLSLNPDDISRMGLSLEALGPLRDLLEGCANSTTLGQDDLFRKSYTLVEQSLTQTTDTFCRLKTTGLVADDKLRLAGLNEAVRQLFGSRI